MCLVQSIMFMGEAKFTAIHVVVMSFNEQSVAHLLNIYSLLRCHGLNTLDRIVCWSSVVACWLNG